VRLAPRLALLFPLALMLALTLSPTGAHSGGLTARLLPPGWRDKPRQRLDSTTLHMPAALRQGSRAGPASFTSYPTRASIAPAPARLGQKLVYHASVLVDLGTAVKFDRPAEGGELSWGAIRTGRSSVNSPRAPLYSGADSVWISAPVQVFATGRVAIPGPAIEIRRQGGESARIVRRLPTLQLLVLPTITAADTNAQLRALHGPLAAPWWERVPWRLVIAGVLLLAAIAAAVVAWRRRRRRPVVAPAVRVPVAARDPGAEALAELARLRARRLPESGLFGEHALALTRILRRYLEAVVGTPRPGDTSPELVARLRQSKLGSDDVSRLEGLLGLWDRVKFARAPLGVEEAKRCELAVEALVRRREAREVA
jgi:hypothetical protein